MTASGLPSAPARVGVAPGWWITSIRQAAQTGHRLEISASTSRRSHRTLCGRTLTRAHEVRADAGHVEVCSDCRTRAARCPDPDQPVATEHSAPPPTVRRSPASTTAPAPNTAATRMAARARFRDVVVLSDSALDYVPQPYGFDEDAEQAARLLPDDVGGASPIR